MAGTGPRGERVGADGLTDERRERAEWLAEEQEAAQIAAWERCADYLRRIASGAPGILDSRSAALILRHESTMRGHLLALAADLANADETEARLLAQSEERFEERNAAFIEAGHLSERCAKLGAELEEARADVLQARADAEAFRIERNEAFAQVTRLGEDYAKLRDVAEGRERAITCLMRDLEGARAEAETLRAERDAALARLAPSGSAVPGNGFGGGCVVIELGVRVR